MNLLYYVDNGTLCRNYGKDTINNLKQPSLPHKSEREFNSLGTVNVERCT